MARRPPAVAEMIAVLSRVKELLAGSQESLWAALTPAEIVAVLDGELRSLAENGRLRDKAELAYLFAPTGQIQDISMANHWSDEYLELSSRFDAVAGELGAADA
jgi:hypothetical protein